MLKSMVFSVFMGVMFFLLSMANFTDFFSKWMFLSFLVHLFMMITSGVWFLDVENGLKEADVHDAVLFTVLSPFISAAAARLMIYIGG